MNNFFSQIFGKKFFKQLAFCSLFICGVVGLVHLVAFGFAGTSGRTKPKNLGVYWENYYTFAENEEEKKSTLEHLKEVFKDEFEFEFELSKLNNEYNQNLNKILEKYNK